MEGVLFFNEGGKNSFITRNHRQTVPNDIIYYSCTVYNALSPDTHKPEGNIHLSLLPKTREPITLHIKIH